jgi:hypothetical protein
VKGASAAALIAVLAWGVSSVGPGAHPAQAAAVGTHTLGTIVARPASIRASAGGWTQLTSGISRPRGVIPLVFRGQKAGPSVASPSGSGNANPFCGGCNPPLVFHRGAPVMGGFSGTPAGNITITPVYWAPAPYVFPAVYKTIINGYIANVAADSQKNTNVFSVGTQYYQQPNAPPSAPIEHITYVITAGAEVDDTNAYPAPNLTTGCVPATGYTDCVADGALRTELQAMLTGLGRPLTDNNLYMVLFPAAVETCQTFGSDATGTPCSHLTYCAYHSGMLVNGNTNAMVYGNQPYPQLNGCTDPANGPQAPNGDAFGDAELSAFSHEANESITDFAGAWIDNHGFENGDECVATFGLPLGGIAGNLYNQVINGAHYYTQDEFSNEDYALGFGDLNHAGGTKVAGCVQNEELPTAAFSSPGSIGAGVAAPFNGSASADADNATGLTFSWNWGDGTANGSGATPTHVFVTGGTYTVSLTVTDFGGWSAAISHSVMVGPSVTGVSPGLGAAAGGITATITGGGFSMTGGATTVAFGANAATGVSCSSTTSCTAIVPAGTGTVDVTVTVSAMTSAVSAADRFTYIAPAAYTAVTPVRLMDTRLSGGPLGPHGLRNLTVTGSSPLAPPGATAVVVNVTVTNTTAPSYLTAFPAGAPQPLASNLNYYANSTIPNLVSVQVGSGGAITFFNAAGSTDVVVDLEGYYAAPSGNAGGEVALPPARITDTRVGSGLPNAGHTLGQGASLNIQVTGAGGVPPTGASAVILNITVTNTTAPSWLVAWPTGTTMPLASNLDWTAGVTIPNRVFVPIGTGGQVSVFNSAGSVDVIIDVSGYFTDSTLAGKSFYSMPPVRIADTRLTAQTLGQGGTLVLQVGGNTAGVPSNASAVVLNVTVTNTTASSWLVAYPSTGTRPLASDLDWIAGKTIPNLAVATLGTTGAITFFNSAGSTDVVVDLAGWYG